MTVLDAFAVLAYLRGEPAKDEVRTLLSGPSVLTSVNAAEVVDRLVRAYGWHPDVVSGDLTLLRVAGMDTVPVDASAGLLAGELRARHYHRTRCAVSLADCVAAAVALTSSLPLATSDVPLAAVVRAEGGRVHPLPDVRGTSP